MNWLAENALPIWMAGAVAFAAAIFVYSQLRTQGALYGVLGVVLTTALLLLFNWYVETPREEVEQALYGLAATVEANDVDGALAYLSPELAPNAKELKKDIESLMPQVRIERARVMGTPEIEMKDDNKRAVVKAQGIIVAVTRRDGMKGGAEDHVIMEWVRSGDRWLVRDYVAQKNMRAAVGRGSGRANSTP